MERMKEKAAQAAEVAKAATKVSADKARCATKCENVDLKAKVSEAYTNAKDVVTDKAQAVGEKVKDVTADAIKKGADMIETLADKAHTAAANMKS